MVVKKMKNNNDSEVRYIRCSCCDKDKKDTDFYSSNSHFNKATGKVHVCKQCVWDYAEKDIGDLVTVKETLRMIDKPFLDDLWKSSVDEATKTGKKVFRTYMKNIVIPSKKDLNWGDSIFKYQPTIQNLDGDFNENEDITTATIQWGKGKKDWEYEFLDNEEHRLKTSFECDDYGMEMIMKDICFLNLDIEKFRQKGNPADQKTIISLIEMRNKLMQSANMNPIQTNGSELDDQITLGTLIKKYEKERPVPKPISDEMKEYIDTFMVGHLAKMEGLNNEMTEKYETALSEYTIQFSELDKHKEDIDDQ